MQVFHEIVLSKIIGKVIRPFHCVFNLQAVHRELVLCVLPLILSMRSLKKSIVGRPVQFHGSIQIPQSNIHREAPAVRGIYPYCTRIPYKRQLSSICYGK